MKLLLIKSLFYSTAITMLFWLTQVFGVGSGPWGFWTSNNLMNSFLLAMIYPGVSFSHSRGCDFATYYAVSVPNILIYTSLIFPSLAVKKILGWILMAGLMLVKKVTLRSEFKL